MYDLAVYNHLKKAWIAEGRSLAVHQAEALRRRREEANPSASYKIVPAQKSRRK